MTPNDAKLATIKQQKPSIPTTFPILSQYLTTTNSMLPDRVYLEEQNVHNRLPTSFCNQYWLLQRYFR